MPLNFTGPIVMKLVAIEKALKELKNGKSVILTDHSDEVRGCFVTSAENSDSDMINEMIFYGRSPIQLAMSREQFTRLDLPLDEVQHENSQISINSSNGIGSGMSAIDRNFTIKTAASAEAQPKDIVSPGHIFPVDVVEGGCLVKPMFAEAASDLVRLAKQGESAVVCKILNETGVHADSKQLQTMAEELGLAICSIHDLIEYRFRHEPLVERINIVDLPTEYGKFRLHVYKAMFDSSRGIDLALTFGKDTFSDEDIPLVRVHSEWSIANIVNRLSFEEGSYLNRAMKKVSESGGPGAIIFLRNTPEQHTNSLFNHEKKPTDIWIENGRLKTLSPMGNNMSYGFGAQILRDLGVKKMNILSNKGATFKGIDKYGLEILDQIPF